jgi:D-xylonolactonase
MNTIHNDRLNIEQVVHESCHCGENPLWHPFENQLYWTDIDRGQMYRFNPSDRTHELIYEGRPVGGFTMQADGKLLLFRDCGNIVTWCNGKIHDTVVKQLTGEAGRRFNDVIADPKGRVFCGTLSPKSLEGKLYRIDLDGSVHCVLDHVHCSNGMGFTPDKHPPKRLYFTETMAHMIWAFDFEEASGAITNQRPFADFTSSKLLPDGLTVDAQGDVWSASYGGHSVIRIGHDGQLKECIRLPTACITCPTFGGEALKELYITSAGGQDKHTHGSAAGALFRITTRIGGVSEYASRIGL